MNVDQYKDEVNHQLSDSNKYTTLKGDPIQKYKTLLSGLVNRGGQAMAVYLQRSRDTGPETSHPPHLLPSAQDS